MIRTKVDFYYHYGIYVDDETVIQFGPPDGASRDPDEIEVISTDIDIFRNGGEVETAKLDLSERLKRNSADKTVEIARSRIGEKGYNILHNNCEHFANECVFGAPHSGGCGLDKTVDQGEAEQAIRQTRTGRPHLRPPVRTLSVYSLAPDAVSLNKSGA